MKKYYCLLTILFLIFCYKKTYAQEKNELYTSKFIVKVEGGLNIPLTNMNQNEITDFFVEYNTTDKKMIPSVSVIWFLRKRFGIEADVKFVYFNDSKNSYNQFQQFANNEYGENYYVKTSSPVSNNFIPVISFGLVYRIETEHFYFYPKLSLGVTSFYSNWGNVDLKEKDTNYTHKVSFSQGKIAKDNFTITPSLSLGYKISDRFGVDLNLKGSFFRSNFTYEKETTNLYTKEIQFEKIPYKENIYEAYISVGLNYVLAKRKSKE